MVLNWQLISRQVELVGQPFGIDLVRHVHRSPVLETELAGNGLHGLIEAMSIEAEVGIATLLADGEQVGKEEGT